MNYYFFKYKKHFLFKKINAVGHNYLKDTDRMDVYHVDGSITSIPMWSKHTLRLGTDWVLYTKKQMEKESGQKIDLAIGE